MFVIGDRRIGNGAPVYVVAEMSCNHHGRYDEAEAIVRAASDAGADAIKLQTYTPDTMTLESAAAPFRISGTPWHGRTLYDLYQEAMTPWDWYEPLSRLASSLGLQLFSSPFDVSAVNFLEAHNAPAYKVASFENGDIALLRRIAATRRPVIVSTGTTSVEELDLAIATLRESRSGPIALLKCASAYPAPADSINVRAIPALAARYDVPVGFSDHSRGNVAAITSVALGACIIEKHLTLSRDLGGPDADFSLEPNEFTDLVASVRTAEQVLGDARIAPAEAEASARMFRRSLFVVESVRRGEAFSQQNVRSIRPGNGLTPSDIDRVLGRRAAVDIAVGTPLSWELVAGEEPQ